MKIEIVKIKDLKASEYNPRKMSEKEVNDLKASIKEFGFVEPILVNSAENRKNIIIGGHQRVGVAKLLGIEEVPAVYIDIPDIVTEQKLNLRLNKNIGSWDWDLLANIDSTILENVGFDKSEMNIFLNDYNIPNVEIKGEVKDTVNYVIVSFDSDDELNEFKDKMGMNSNTRTLTYKQLKEKI